MSTLPKHPAQIADLARTADTHTPLNLDAILEASFSKLFERVAAGAVEREQNRELAYEAIQWLRDAGFTALRVPKRYGGDGITLPQFFRLLVKLGEANSNLPQILRLNFGSIETRLETSDEASRERWLRPAANGVLFGAAISERTGSTHNWVT
ncbi:acyl-CoA dehydrogenase family protein [Paraburkholderia sp. SG-MS1]|uniref:acyl-CoA dehydrogenase family protein n=1 Tax=Paraburkholderia sp. SG-MS1 TaxID=2023741 RepID=UPI001EEBCA2A|nr:acyl-CoA dehydrogenase family protein [Paraburkholderia sp. SG-MS1]